MDENKAKQIAIAERLQMKLLENFEEMLQQKNMSPTDRATLYRLLSDNGWTLDINQLPKDLQKKLTKDLDPLGFEPENEWSTN